VNEISGLRGISVSYRSEKVSYKIFGFVFFDKNKNVTARILNNCWVIPQSCSRLIVPSCIARSRCARLVRNGRDSRLRQKRSDYGLWLLLFSSFLRKRR
jgi:hypothetical protein